LITKRNSRTCYIIKDLSLSLNDAILSLQLPLLRPPKKQQDSSSLPDPSRALPLTDRSVKWHHFQRSSHGIELSPSRCSSDDVNQRPGCQFRNLLSPRQSILTFQFLISTQFLLFTAGLFWFSFLITHS
jgi:hypothetical protein